MNTPAIIPVTSGPNPVGVTARKRVSRTQFVALILVALLIGAGVWWYKGGRYKFYARNWGVVDAGMVYRSGQVSSGLIEQTLLEHKIGVVLFLSGDKMQREDVRTEVETCKRLGIERLNFPLGGDGTGDLVQYADAVAMMVKATKAGKPVVVHCHTGAQRTGGAVVFYRTLVQGLSGHDATVELESYGHDPDDNGNLIPYLNKNMAEMARLLVERGTIEKVPDPLPVIGL